MMWHKFREKRGTLHLGRRMEVSAAPISFFTAKAIGSNAKMEDFMPHETAQVEAAQSDEQMLSFFKNLVESQQDGKK